MFAQVLAVSLLLFVKGVFTQDDCTGFEQRGVCYANGTYISDTTAASRWMECKIAGFSGLEWTGPGRSCGTIDESYPMRCSASPPERIKVTRAGDFTDDHEGDYECCSPSTADCRTRIVAKIFDTLIPYSKDIELTALDDYSVHCSTIGRPPRNDDFEIIYQDGSANGIGVTRDSCRESGYVCGRGYSRGDVSDSVDRRQMTFARVRWTGDETQGDLFRQDVNDGDHCFACKASHRLGVTRDFDVGCVRAPASKPENISGDCIVTWTYPDPSDVDGYLVTVGLQGGVRTADTSYTIELSSEVPPGTSWPVSVRAYQDIIGPAAEIQSVVCPGACSDACLGCTTCGVCNCTAGWMGDDCCQDVNECDVENGGCSQVCINTDGSFECSCNDGYELDADGISCIDINECDMDNGGCSYNCTNTDGSFECICEDGYELDTDGKTCIDIDECDTNAHSCEQICTNTNGSYECSCNDGYRLNNNGRNCDDINECTEGTHDCDANCHNTDGSFTCSCPGKYCIADDGKSCTSISYAEGYPTTEGGVIKGLVNRPEGIAENSTIACGVSNCPSCDPFESFSCTYGEEFSLNVGTNRRRCFVITVTFDSGRSKVDVYCLYTAVAGGCSVTLQGERVEYRSDSVALNFGFISATSEAACSTDGGTTFEACTSSSQHVVSNPTGFTEITICPVNSGNLCDICRCGKFTFNPDNLAAEGERYPGSITCPTESP